MRKKFTHHHILSGGLFVCGLIVGLFLIFGQSKESKSSVSMLDAEDPPAESRVYAQKIERSVMDLFTGVNRIELHVKPGNTLSLLLEKAGVSVEQRHALIRSLDGVFDIRGLRPQSGTRSGDLVRLHYTDGDSEGLIDLEKVEIYRSSVERFFAEKEGDGYTAREEIFDPAIKVVRKDGIIGSGQSFSLIAQSQGIPYNIIDQFYDILGFDLDFERDIRAGDSFSVLYEAKYGPDGEYLGDGAFLYGEFKNGGKTLKIYRHENKDGKVAYYNETGKGAQKALKRTPIKARISSGYGMRRHPILGYRKGHTGVDFAAGRGTPIPAAGSGTIVYRGTRGGYGKYIKIRHNGTYETAYAHMSNYKRGLGVGSRVSQGQIIGYVGSTGRSTGPHLHYEILKNGRHVNPLRVRMPSVENLKGEELKRFVANREKVSVQFALLGDSMQKYAKAFLND
ncbi:MAG: M23 family metallopeptidase [Alphaproteobacteria bacterium]|nr:M23 family metallopeptidase [Alphaproteobacteria bacterium]